MSSCEQPPSQRSRNFEVGVRSTGKRHSDAASDHTHKSSMCACPAFSLAGMVRFVIVQRCCSPAGPSPPRRLHTRLRCPPCPQLRPCCARRCARPGWGAELVCKAPKVPGRGACGRGVACLCAVLHSIEEKGADAHGEQPGEGWCCVH